MSRRERLVLHRPRLVLLAWLVVVLGSLPLAADLAPRLHTSTIEAAGSESATARTALAERFPGGSRFTVLLVAEPEVDPSRCSALGDRVRAQPGVQQAVGSVSSGLCVVRAGVDRAPNTVVTELREQRDLLERSVGAPVRVTGGPGISADIGEISEQDVRRVELLTLPLVFLLLLLVFRSVVAAVVPLLTGAVSILVASAVLSQVARHVELSPLLMNVVTMLGLGLAVDYGLFITRRFRAELSAGEQAGQALLTTLRTSGRSVVYAGLTVAATLTCLLIPGSLVTTSVAAGGVVVVLVSLAVSATLLPAVLRLLGHRVAALAVPVLRGARTGESPAWGRFASAVVRRPVRCVALGTAVLALLAVPVAGVQMHLPTGAYADLPARAESRQGMERLVAQTGAGEVFPVQVLAESAEGPVTGERRLAAVSRLAGELTRLDGVRRVQVPLTAGGGPAAVSTDGRATVLTVVPDAAPSQERTRRLVRTIRDEVAPRFAGDLRLSVTGETATGLDVDRQVLDRLGLTLLALALVTGSLLVVAFRSVVLPVKAVLLNALVTLATVGAVVAVFQEGVLPGVDPQPMNINTPLIMFALLFGLSTDYEVIIVDRIAEAHRRGADVRAAVVEGLQSTAGMVNGAALIMVTVFAAFLLADLRVVQELGFGLAVAVVLDVVVVRTLVLPAMIVLLGKACWWWPGRAQPAAAHAPPPAGQVGTVVPTQADRQGRSERAGQRSGR